MGWQEYQDHHVTNDPASWSEWEDCVRQTLGGEPLPEMSPVKGVHGWVDGTVVAWHDDERWGVLASPDVEGEVWANYVNIVGKGYTPLRESQRVRFSYRTPGTHGYPHVAEAVQLR
jgi:cold shock CspA family protein